MFCRLLQLRILHIVSLPTYETCSSGESRYSFIIFIFNLFDYLLFHVYYYDIIYIVSTELYKLRCYWTIDNHDTIVKLLHLL